MSYSYRFHPKSKEDYNEAFAWYEDQQKGLGERFLKAVHNKIAEIISNPEAFGSRTNKNFREASLDIFPYLIVYRINKRKRKFISAPFIITKNIPAVNTGKCKLFNHRK